MTVVQLQNEGISTVDEPNDFDKDTLQQVARTTYETPTTGAVMGTTISTPPFVFGAKYQKRLLAASEIVRYYEETGRPLTRANTQWHAVIKIVGEQ
jgi:hypothetical protein